MPIPATCLNTVVRTCGATMTFINDSSKLLGRSHRLDKVNCSCNATRC